MIDKIRKYLDSLFAEVPNTKEVQDAKDELYNNMIERYADCLKDGMDEQEAYDSVIDSLGDIRELFAELNQDIGSDAQESSTDETSAEAENEAAEDSSAKANRSFNPQIDLTGFMKTLGEFTSGIVNGFLGGGEYNGLPLVNTQVVSLQDINSIDIGYISESISLCYATDENITICEYMSKDSPDLYAVVQKNGSELSVKSGHRLGQAFLRSYIIVYLPASWAGSLSLGTVSGSIKSEAAWMLSSLSAKSTSGSIKITSVSAPLIRLSSTSGSINMQHAVGYIEANSVSGSIKIESAEGGGVFKTISGSARMNFTELQGHVTANCTSGSLRLGLPPSASFELNAKSTSGGIHTGFDSLLTYTNRRKAHGFIGQAPYYIVSVQTITGSIHIND